MAAKRFKTVMTNTPESTIQALLAAGKGILAADESFPTIEKRFKELGIVLNEESRRDYRELLTVFATLFDHRVVLETMLLKTGMALSGKDCPQQADLEKVAEATLRCLRRAVPAAVPGIVFLSGGQSDVPATERLNAICQPGGVPWTLSFSFGRALQDAALKTWKGSPANVAVAQAALHQRAKCNGLAVQGEYSKKAERIRDA